MKGLRLTSSFANLEENNYDKILFTLKKTQHYIEKLNDIFSEHLDRTNTGYLTFNTFYISNV